MKTFFWKMRETQTTVKSIVNISRANQYGVHFALTSFLVIFFVFAFVMPLQSSFASQLVNPITTNPQTFSFRDITDITNSTTPTISLDKSSYKLGDPATITIIDKVANVDLSNKDNITATVGPTLVQLT